MRRTTRRHVKPRTTPATQNLIARRAKMASVAAGVGMLTASLSVGVWAVVGESTHGTGQSVADPGSLSSAAPWEPGSAAATLPSDRPASGASSPDTLRRGATPMRASRSQTRPPVPVTSPTHVPPAAPSTAAPDSGRRTTTTSTQSQSQKPKAPTAKASTAPASSAPPALAAAGDTATAYEARILTLVNAERTERGLTPLRLSTCADGYAEKWAAHMAATGDFSHQSLSPMLAGCGATRAAENIAEGSVSADGMMDMWMSSPGHRANILDPTLTHIGIGAVRAPDGTWWATQDFLRL